MERVYQISHQKFHGHSEHNVLARVHKALSCHAGYCYVYTHSRYIKYVRCIFNECLTDCVTSTAVRDNSSFSTDKDSIRCNNAIISDSIFRIIKIIAFA